MAQMSVGWADAAHAVIDLTGDLDLPHSSSKRPIAHVEEASTSKRVRLAAAVAEIVDLTESPARVAPTAVSQATSSSRGGNAESLSLQMFLLSELLQNASNAPTGPSWRENNLVAQLPEFGIEAYGFEVPLGNGVCDCVGVDTSGRLCIVEAKCMQSKHYAQRRQKVSEQCSAYGQFLAQQARSDVIAYIFDDTNGLVNLEEFATYKFEEVKHQSVRGRCFTLGRHMR